MYRSVNCKESDYNHHHQKKQKNSKSSSLFLLFFIHSFDNSNEKENHFKIQGWCEWWKEKKLIRKMLRNFRKISQKNSNENFIIILVFRKNQKVKIHKDKSNRMDRFFFRKFLCKQKKIHHSIRYLDQFFNIEKDFLSLYTQRETKRNLFKASRTTTKTREKKTFFINDMAMKKIVKSSFSSFDWMKCV